MDRTFVLFFSLILVSGCGSSGTGTPPPAPVIPASQTFHLYNSLSKPISIQLVAPSVTPERVPIELNPNGHTTIIWHAAESLQFKIVGPAGLSQHDQTVEVPTVSQTKGDILLDFGAKTTFYQYPVFYVPANAPAKWKVPEEMKQKYPLKQLAGPKARYDLDYRALGINKGTQLFKESTSGPDKGEVLISIVTAAALEQVKKGADLNYVDRE